MRQTRTRRRIKRLTQLPAFLILEIKKAITTARQAPENNPRVCAVIRYDGKSYIIEEHIRESFTLYRLNSDILKAEYTRGYQAPFKTKIIEFKESELWEI
jgi:hypothetical protein